MTVEFETDLESNTELHSRQYLATASFRVERRRATAISGIVFAGLLLLWSYFSDGEISGFMWSLSIGGAVVMALVAYLNHAPTVKHRLKKHLHREYGADYPIKVSITVKDGQLTSSSEFGGAIIPLAALSIVSEDETYLDIQFSRNRMALVPLTAFPSAEFKAAFIEALHENEV